MSNPDTMQGCNGHLASSADTYLPGIVDPAVSGVPVEVSEGVFVIGDNRIPFVPNIGIVLGDHAALVVDTGIGPSNGAVVLDHARRLAGNRKLYLAITQFDPGHGFGAQAFRGAATIVYSDAQRYRLPTDDQTVHIDDRVLFGGDLFETRMFPILPYFPPFDSHFDGRRWIDTLDRLIATPPDIVVPGHGEITDVGQITAVRDYLAYLREQTRQLWLAGASHTEAAARIAEYAQTTWPTWDGPRNIRYAVRAFYDQLDREQ